MREPIRAALSELEELPDRPAVFLLWAAQGTPYLAKTALLRRRVRRVVTRMGGVLERVEYWTVGSQLEAMLVHLQLAQLHFPEDWPKMTRLKPPAFFRLVTDNAFPRSMVTTRLGRGLFVGPFAGRAAAERYENETLDLFQLRRCEENLAPSPDHPGCMYGEMNKCLRPCQAAVSRDEYAHEAQRIEQFLRTGGASLVEPAEAARERASAEMQFEEAERQHQRVERIRAAASTAGELARPLDQLAGVAVVRAAASSSATTAIHLLFFIGGQWQEPRQLLLTDTVDGGQSLDRRVRELIADVAPGGPPILEHMSILTRWHGSSWRDGEWIGFDSLDRIPYRKIVNAIGRVAGAKGVGDAKV